MTPAARAQAAIDLLDAWAPGRPMDRILVAWGRRSRYAGSKDRAAVADLVYDALRRWRSLA
ncbi:MAG: RsmB/NOP family class I SAM-dependent RNA methyltransferase, partial [Paracoccaceae bacterium]